MTDEKPKLNVTCILDLLENASVQDLDRLGEEPIVFARELKSAVQGLINDLLRAINNTSDESAKWCYKYAIYCVKKWFGDVVEENAKRKD